MKPLTAGLLLCTLALSGCTKQPDSSASYARGLPTLAESTEPILRLIEDQLEQNLEEQEAQEAQEQTGQTEQEAQATQETQEPPISQGQEGEQAAATPSPEETTAPPSTSPTAGTPVPPTEVSAPTDTSTDTSAPTGVSVPPEPQPESRPAPEPEREPEPALASSVPAESGTDPQPDTETEPTPDTDPLDSEAYKPQYVVERVLENVIETVLDPARYVSEAAQSKEDSSSADAATAAATNSPSARPLLDEATASASIARTLRAGSYAITLTDDRLTVGNDQEHTYFIFAVSDAGAAEPVAQTTPETSATDTTGTTGTAGTTDTTDITGANPAAVIGLVAVDRVTGELYYYLGDGVLEDYASFPLYDANAAWASRWVGTYQGPGSMTLEVLEGTADAFTYRFSDGTTGQAQLSGSNAKSTDPAISFLFADDTITVISERLVGNYQRTEPANHGA